MDKFFLNFRVQCKIYGKKLAADLFYPTGEGLKPEGIRLLKNLLKGFPQLTIERNGWIATREIEIFNITNHMVKKSPKFFKALAANHWFRKNEAANYIFTGLIQGIEAGYKELTAIPPSDLVSAKDSINNWMSLLRSQRVAAISEDYDKIRSEF